MAEFHGEKKLGHSAPDVFSEGLQADYWGYDNGGIVIKPRCDKIAIGESVGMSFKVGFLSIGCPAKVVECVKNERVVLEGYNGFGEVILIFALEEYKKGKTNITYDFMASINKLPNSEKIDAKLQNRLDKNVPAFADSLTEQIDESLNEQKAA